MMVDPRVLMAAERTLLAWVRTGLAMMGFGFVVARFGLFMRELATAKGEPISPGHGGSLWFGVGLVLLGVVVLLVSAARHYRYTKALLAGNDPPVPSLVFGVVATVLLSIIGVFMAAYLLAVG